MVEWINLIENNLYHSFYLEYFLAQQWKLTSEGKLINKLRSWAHRSKESTYIAKDSKVGPIIITKKIDKKFLTLNSTSGEVVYENRFERGKRLPQRWRIGYPDADGWRNITHPQSGGLYLTVTFQGSRNILTVKSKGMSNLKPWKNGWPKKHGFTP